MRCQKITNRIR